MGENRTFLFRANRRPNRSAWIGAVDGLPPGQRCLGTEHSAGRSDLSCSTSVSTADCHEPSAWRGKSPVQVGVARTSLTRTADSQSPGAPAMLSRRRPFHSLGAEEAQLFSRMQKFGKPELER
jgi:hypothetical protein